MTIILRKLTKKSTLDFGKYAGMTVRNVIDLYGKNYLRWCYYNLSNISFIDDLLEELEITEKIAKPGKNLEIFEKYFKRDIKDIKGVEGVVIRKKYRSKQRGRNKHQIEVDKIYYSKKSLQRRNQGHY